MKTSSAAHHTAISDEDDEVHLRAICLGNAAVANNISAAASTKKRQHFEGSDDDSHGGSSAASSGSSSLNNTAKKMRKTKNGVTPDLQLRTEFTTIAGQLKLNPHFTEEEAKVAAKREYNRRNAARSRARNKHAVADLRDKCDSLEQRAEELSRENEILRAKVEFFQKQQQKTTNNNKAPDLGLGPAPQTGFGGLPSTYELLQGLTGGPTTAAAASTLLQTTNQMREHALSWPSSAVVGDVVPSLVTDMNNRNKNNANHLMLLRQSILERLSNPSA